MNKDIKTFREGIDTDTEDRLLPDGRYRYANNMLSGTSSESNVGAGESVQSNVLRNLVVGFPDFTDTFATNVNSWQLNQDIGSISITDPTQTTIGPNLKFVPPTPFDAAQGDAWRRMLATDYTYEITLVVTTPGGAPDGSMSVYVGENDSAPTNITVAGTYVITKVAKGSALILYADFTEFNNGQSFNVTSITVKSQNKPLVLTGTNKVIGSCKDIKNNAIIYMVYNSTNKHKLIRFYVDTKRIQDLLPGADTSILGWTADGYIWNPKIVETGDDQLLFFLDETTKLPRRISTSLWENRGSVYNYTLTEDDISVAKKQPSSEPTWEYANDASQKSNFLKEINFQFRYRWIYEDGEISGLSPISTISIVPGDEPTDNYINVTVNSGGKQVVKVQVLRRIGNGVSETGTTNPEWYIFKTVTKADNAWSDDTNYSVNFYNTETLISVSRTDSDKNFELVPREAGAQEIVDGNQIIYGDVVEGYGNIDTNVTITPRYDRTGNIKFTSSTNTINLSNAILPAIGDNLFVIVNVGAGDNVYYYGGLSAPLANYDDLADQIRLAITYNTGLSTAYNNVSKIITCAGATSIGAYTIEQGGTTGFTALDVQKSGAQLIISGSTDDLSFDEINSADIPYTSPSFTIPVGLGAQSAIKIQPIGFIVTAGLIGTAYKVILKDSGGTIYAISEQLTANPTPSTLSLTWGFPMSAVVGKTFKMQLDAIGGSNITVAAGAQLIVSVVQFSYLEKGFKSGSKPSFGIVYYDQYMRQCGVQAITDVYFKFPTERTWLNNYSEHESTKDAEGYIPRADWEIKHLPPDEAYYYKWVTRPDIEGFVELLVKTFTYSGTTFKFKVTSLANYPYLEYKDFKAGDRVRLLYGVTSTPFIGTVYDGYVETTILSYDEANSEITCDNTNGDFNSAVIGDNDIVEIYIKSQAVFFFEFTPTYLIGNPTEANRYHEGPDQNQDPNNPITTPAKGSFDSGNVYFRFRNLENAAGTGARTVLVESAAISDQYESSYWDKGRVQIETPNQTSQRLETMLRWGGKLFQDTQINNMSTFDEGNYKILNAKFNAITGLRQIGYTLKILQFSNFATAFIGRREVQNADGSTQLVVTDSLIGNYNYSNDGYGTKEKGSIAVSQRSLYFFDTIKGMYIRESGNEPTPISNYYMIRYWSNKALDAAAGDFKVVSEYDSRMQLVWVHMIGSNFSETIVFSEKDDRWKSWEDLYITSGETVQGAEMLGAIGRTFVAYLNGYLWEHYEGTGYLNIFGVQRKMVAESVFNVSPQQVKVMLTHGLHANMAPLKSTLTTPPSEMYPVGMRTILKENNYKNTEGIYNADIKGDGYTKGQVADDSAQFKQQLVNGRPMRGHVLTSRVEFESTDIVILFTQEAGVILSPRS